MACWGTALDVWGRNDLFLHSKPKFKEPGTITLKEYKEKQEAKNKEKERQKLNDL